MNHTPFCNMQQILAMLLIICILIPFSTQAGECFIEMGKKAPDFTLPDLREEEYILSSHTGEHKATLILIWGVWCPYCRAIMVMLKKDYPQLKAAGIEIVTISIRESPNKVARFIGKLDPDFIVLTDEWGDLKDTYKIKEVPKVVILDKDQNVETMAITTSSKMVEALIKKSIDARASAVK